MVGDLSEVFHENRILRVQLGSSGYQGDSMLRDVSMPHKS